MTITLTKDMIDLLGIPVLAGYGLSEDKVRWKTTFDIDLSDLTRAKAQGLRAALAKHAAAKGFQSRLDDVDRWLVVLDGEKVKIRRLRDLPAVMKQHLKAVPHHWVYERRTTAADVWQPYYVSNIEYIPTKKTNWGVIPEHVVVTMHWEELGRVCSATEKFHREDAVGMSVSRVLAERGYVTESPALRAAHDARTVYYAAIHDKVGRQFEAVGVAEPETRDRDSWYRRTSDIVLERDGVPARVVVDILQEGDETRSSGRDERPSGSFWGAEPCDHDGSPDDDDRDLGPGDEDPDGAADPETPVVPLAPALMCFDLRRQLRMKIYVDQMTEYRYRTDLADKLILPAEVRDLVDMLVAHRGGFRDIVGGKGGGAVILCAGPPGTGKTLTSEIYSEAMQRPLYSVQCSQLGLSPDELEKELLKVFARAARWGAILLLDEADVYVAARGSDLTQNAIVGVFLRVLEYYAGILFLTTNRADLVDDAVASRCLARIDYALPSEHDQRRIWCTLADAAGISISDDEIRAVVARHPRLSGRDVKNLLKLGSMVAAARGVPLTAAVVDGVKRFKPTSDQE